MTNELTKRTQLPAYLQDEVTDYGLERVGQYIRPPRIKVIQPQANEPYDQFEVGETVLTPQLIRLATFDKKEKKGSVWHCVPLFFYPEWCLWNPIELKGQEPAVAQRSTDPKSELAHLAQSPETWSAPHASGAVDDKGNPLMVRYVEHLNFIVAPLMPEYAQLQFAISFYRAEMRSGVNMCSLLKMRNAPMCAQIFKMQAGHRKNNKGNWYGIDASIPSEGDMLVQDAEQYKFYKSLHESLTKAFNENRLEVDHDDDVVAGSVKPATDETEF